MRYHLFDVAAELLAGLLDWPKDWRPAREARRRGIDIGADESGSTHIVPTLLGQSRARGFGETLRRALARRASTRKD